MKVNRFAEIEVPPDMNDGVDEEEDEDISTSKDDAWNDLGLARFTEEADNGNSQ